MHVDPFLRAVPLNLLLLAAIGCAVSPQAVLKPPDSPPVEAETPDIAPNHLALARSLMAQGHWAVALNQLTAAIEANGDDPESYYLLGVCQQKSGNPAAAEASFQSAIQRDRNHAPAYSGLGMVRFMNGQTRQARKDMLKAVNLNPANPDYLNDLGVIEMRINHPRDALAHLEQCLRIDSNHLPAKNNLAECLIRLGREDHALAFLKAHFPDAVACNNLGGIYLKLGFRSRARIMFTRALDRDPDLDAARRNLKRLEVKENSQP